MFTQRIAFPCVFTACLLLSCNIKRTESTDHNLPSVGLENKNADVLPKDFFEVKQYSEVFTKNITQYFTAASIKKTIITASGGLKVTVNPGVLETEEGLPVKGKINVSILELTNSYDLFKSNAATVSDGRLLASGGSYYIGMECNGQKLRIKEGKTIQVDFPLLVKDKMELFYGERNNDGYLNWEKLGIDLKPKPEEVSLFENDRGYSDFPIVKSNRIFGDFKLYKTLKEEVYYYDKKMTLEELIDTLNRYSPKVYVDTVYTWPKELKDLPSGTRVDTSFLYSRYGPPHQYFLKTYKSIADQKEELAKQQATRDSLIENWKPKSLAGQIQKYYMPSSIRALGWINCDRFYQPGRQTDIEVELPVTLNDSHIEFFLLYKSISGLMNLQADISGSKKVFRSLPEGEPVILIGFTKINGQLLQCREEFMIQKNKILQLEFKDISTEEMARMFGKNVRI